MQWTVSLCSILGPKPHLCGWELLFWPLFPFCAGKLEHQNISTLLCAHTKKTQRYGSGSLNHASCSADDNNSCSWVLDNIKNVWNKAVKLHMLDVANIFLILESMIFGMGVKCLDKTIAILLLAHCMYYKTERILGRETRERQKKEPSHHLHQSSSMPTHLSSKGWRIQVKST